VRGGGRGGGGAGVRVGVLGGGRGRQRVEGGLRKKGGEDKRKEGGGK